MAERVLTGIPASPGVAIGAAHVLDCAPADAEVVVAPAERPAEARRAASALEAAAQEMEALAERLRADGRSAEAEIVETGVLMARDPGLEAAVETAVCDEGRPAPAAILAAASGQADLIAALDDATLAARADDVRSIGRRAARLAVESGAAERNGARGGRPTDDEDVVLVAADLGPADVAELGDRVRGIALAAGGATAHAAIVARSLGLPMVVGAGEELLALAPGTTLVLDGDAGSVVAEPEPARAAAARDAVVRRLSARTRSANARNLPAVTTDGHRVRVLVNAASAAELAVGLEAGAEGIGLLRTELAFLDARGWPTEAEHRRALEPVLASLRGGQATARVLDFGGDKLPPFLHGARERGTRLLLNAPDALGAQLRAILHAGRDCDLRIMFPMVAGPVELLAARDALADACAAVPDARRPALGAMIETPGSAAGAHALALRADFLSIGTNDLTASTLAVDRFAPGEAAAYHPRVLALIDRAVRAAGAAGIPLEVCGEAASDPRMLPLLVGLGVGEISVGAARVGTVRAWVRALELQAAQQLAGAALQAPTANAVADLAAPVAERLRLLDEAGDAAGEGVEGGAGVLPVGPQA